MSLYMHHFHSHLLAQEICYDCDDKTNDGHNNTNIRY